MKELLHSQLQKIVDREFPGTGVSAALEKPTQAGFGDYTSNIAMVLAGRLKSKPRDVAEKIRVALGLADGLLEEVTVAGPGFLNFRLKAGLWIEKLRLISEQGERFGFSKNFQGKKAMVEFVSANPTGPLHIGHGRNAVVGDTLARLLRAVGYEVVSEYYVNDGGIQINTLGKSVYFRLKELKGEKIEFPETCYQGDYIRDMAREMLPRWEEFSTWEEEKTLRHLGEWAGEKILGEILEDLRRIGVEFQNIFFESKLYQEGDVEKTLTELKAKGLTFEEGGALWLKSTAFGDDKDRVLIKSDGSYTYLTPDIAYHRRKFDTGYDLLVNVWGADHAGYVPRLKAALQGLGREVGSLHVVLIQMVSLIRAGELLSMSTRRAQYETLEAVVKAVSPDVARYFFMMRSYQAQLDFDLELARQQSSENPVYYIQYAHARLSSLFAKAREAGHTVSEKPVFDPSFVAQLDLPEEIALAQTLLYYPQVIEQAASDLAPHRVATFALDLARQFQAYYDRARADERYRMLAGSPERVQARFFFLACIRQVLRNALFVLGISAPESM